MQCFGGAKTYGDNKALHYSCNELKENDIVYQKGFPT